MPEIVACTSPSRFCKCSGSQPCEIQCLSPNDCASAHLFCPLTKPCTIICGDGSCRDMAIAAPTNADFALYCDGDGSCQNMVAYSDKSANVVVSCDGIDSCRGAGTEINCGTADCVLMFTGQSSGALATVNAVATGAESSVVCVGLYAQCPGRVATPMQPLPMVMGPSISNAVPIMNMPAPPSPISPPTNPSPSSPSPANLSPTQPNLPNEPVIVQPQPIVVTCAAGSPSARECVLKGMVLRECGCECASACPSGQVHTTIGTNQCMCATARHCCLTAFVGYTAWNGLCWDETSEAACLAEANMRCVWDPNYCLPSPPVNSLDPSRACLFTGAKCTSAADCCSEACRADGKCR